MATKTLTYLAGGADGKIRVKTSVRAVGDLEVVVRVTHSGVCGTDVHDLVSGCGLGHEGVGVIEQIGQGVTEVKIGQRVGWGWLHTACGHCNECFTGHRQYCPAARCQKYGELEQGSFGDYVIWRQDFVYPIPDAIESKFAGPLNCAGITVYEGLLAASTKVTDRVGIIGLGGLGHLAVMYARAMGCEVTVFSSRGDKREDALALGATEFHKLSQDGSISADGPSKINVMLLVGGSVSDLGFLMPLLASRARIVPLVIQSEPLMIPYMPFLIPEHQIIASTSGARDKAIEALGLAARHNIKPWIEEYPMSEDGLKKAFAALDSGLVRYRAVLSTDLQGSGFKSTS